jgi:predicted DNA-binding transcriptional regulator AlpA
MQMDCHIKMSHARKSRDIDRPSRDTTLQLVDYDVGRVKMSNQATPFPKKRRTGSAPSGFERVSTLSGRIGLAESTIRGWIGNKSLGFPEPIKLGARVAIFSIAAVNQWLAERGRAPAA